MIESARNWASSAQKYYLRRCEGFRQSKSATSLDCDFEMAQHRMINCSWWKNLESSQCRKRTMWLSEPRFFAHNPIASRKPVDSVTPRCGNPRGDISSRANRRDTRSAPVRFLEDSEWLGGTNSGVQNTLWSGSRLSMNVIALRVVNMLKYQCGQVFRTPSAVNILGKGGLIHGSPVMTKEETEVIQVFRDAAIEKGSPRFCDDHTSHKPMQETTEHDGNLPEAGSVGNRQVIMVEAVQGNYVVYDGGDLCVD
ncbi:hypothetical protein C8R44DRAFT_742702 [Mycena epipterygia]|nr:hypothetical protein C8R44DRAFT_742702 [Mycena epipterygia]